MIVSFVVAIMALIPLRFVEVGQSMERQSSAQVLGETTVSKVVLPNDKVVMVNQEAPTEGEMSEEIEGCVTQEEMDKDWSELREMVTNGSGEEKTVQEAVERLIQNQRNVCQ